jgi:hypothetical protein
MGGRTGPLAGDGSLTSAMLGKGGRGPAVGLGPKSVFQPSARRISRPPVARPRVGLCVGPCVGRNGKPGY